MYFLILVIKTNCKTLSTLSYLIFRGSAQISAVCASSACSAVFGKVAAVGMATAAAAAAAAVGMATWAVQVTKVGRVVRQ